MYVRVLCVCCVCVVCVCVCVCVVCVCVCVLLVTLNHLFTLCVCVQSDHNLQALRSTVEAVAERRETVLKRWSEFKETAAARRERLEEARKLQQLMRDADELDAWIDEKLQVATDNAHEDFANLQVGCANCCC